MRIIHFSPPVNLELCFSAAYSYLLFKSATAFSSDSKVWMTDSARMSQRQTGQAGGVKYLLLIFERHTGQETNSVRNFRMA